MRGQSFLPFLLLGLFSLSPAFADDQEDKFSGEISTQGTLVNLTGNKAKFNEYGDIKDGVFGKDGSNLIPFFGILPEGIVFGAGLVGLIVLIRSNAAIIDGQFLKIGDDGKRQFG